MRNIGELNGVSIIITDHALKRMIEMEMTAETIRDILTSPEETYQSTKYPDNTCYRSGDFTLTVEKKKGRLVVKTALYGTRKAWLQASLDGKLPEDRPYRDNEQLPRW